MHLSSVHLESPGLKSTITVYESLVLHVFAIRYKMKDSGQISNEMRIRATWLDECQCWDDKQSLSVVMGVLSVCCCIYRSRVIVV